LETDFAKQGVCTAPIRSRKIRLLESLISQGLQATSALISPLAATPAGLTIVLHAVAELVAQDLELDAKERGARALWVRRLRAASKIEIDKAAIAAFVKANESTGKPPPQHVVQ